MTDLAPGHHQALRRGAVRATYAPSVHNTQPWRFRLTGSSLEIHADWGRQLRVIDPRGRQLLIGCGCAIFNARVSLAAAGYAAAVDRFPDPDQPNLLARLTLPGPPVEDPIAALDPFVVSRHTNRQPFADEPAPDDVLGDLIDAARHEGAELVPITQPEHRLAIARLTQQAADLENLDLAYWAEMRDWTGGGPGRRDGVLPAPESSPAVRDLLIRDFHDHGVGRLPAGSQPGQGQTLLLLGTQQDSPAAWVQAGEALERVLLEITRRGYSAGPSTQLVEVAATNALLRQELSLSMHPHLLLRVGRAPPSPASRRRRLADMVEDLHPLKAGATVATASTP